MIYCLYNSDTNALLGVDTEPLEPADGQAVVVAARDTLPESAVEFWNPAILAFQTKPTAQLTTKEFLKRFTATEYATIKGAAAQNGVVDYYFQLLLAASYVCVSDADTIAGVQMLAQAGLIGEGRAAEILS